MCHLSQKIKGECDRCGRVPAELHLPELFHGFYCSTCCPECSPARTKQPEQEPEPAAA
jgi:hypothetical protein